MSDVSEHDSDSDTELNKVNKIEENVVEKQEATENTGAQVAPGDSVNIVDELKQQAAIAEEQDARPEWEKYMQQNEVTGAYTYTDPNDGTVYEWDQEKRGWIPKIDDDFIAMYQANYGFTATGEHNPLVNVQSEEEETGTKNDGAATTNEAENKGKSGKDERQADSATVGKKRKQEEKKEWFDIDQQTNNNVYVSGLPLETTEEKFLELMSKCGIIMDDDNGKPKIKMYKTAEGSFKGDARCCYLKHESVILAREILDESDFNGSTIHVEQAVFQMKGEFNPALKPKKKKKKKKPGKGQDKLLDWVDRPVKRSKFDRIVILKNMFSHVDFEKDPTLINDLKADLRSECEQYGDIKKVMVFDRNKEGIASILFHEPEFADKCIEALNGRFYAGRVITAETYDGVTKYDVQETEEEMEKRIQEWERFISGDDDEEEEGGAKSNQT